MRIVRIANFVMPRSGGLRTALLRLGEGYVAAGHEPVLVIPGDRESAEETEQGLVVTLPGPLVPFLGGYRVLLSRRKVTRLLRRLAPDRLEVSDRTTLRWTGRWAREHGVRSAMVSHESLSGLLRLGGAGREAVDALADRLNRATARSYDTVICTTSWAAAEFRRVGATNLVSVPLGVDLELFHPGRRVGGGAGPLLVHCGRLSPEKRPGRSIEALRQVRAAGVPAELVVAGDGPLRDRLVRQAAGLPVRFIGFEPDRMTIAKLLADADVALAPGPVETFGLAALEALACGTPVVVDASSALPEVIGEAGVAVAGEDFATGVLRILERPEEQRRAEARARAERFGWAASVDGFLAAQLVEAASGERSTAGPQRESVAAR